MQQRLEHEPLKEPMHICVWGNDRMDGQKSIWFDQMAAMDPSEYTWTWVLAGTTAAAPGGSESDLDAGVDVDGVLRAVARDNPDGVVSNLIRMHRQQEKEGRTNIHVRFSPLESMALRYDVELEQRPVYANGTVGLSFNEAYRAHNLASRGGGAAAGAGSQRHSTLEYVPEMYMLDCWLEAKAAAGWVVGVDQSSQAQRLLDAIQPQWVRELYSGMAGFIRDEAACDVVVFGNNRGSTSDVLLVEAARLVGVPSVMELLCVFPEKHTLPDAVIAPSAYALEHSSLTHLVTLPTLQTAVIAPSVSPELLLQRPSDPLSLPDPNFFTVGLSGRVSPEKSPGLFLTMAHTLVATRADLASKLRFVIIGDGPLRAHLEDLVRWLGLEGRVKMVGWQDRAGLRHHLGRLDVLVAPALRAWSETFCIMNIEAMAMGVPVVTFGVGGQGEYVSGRPLEGYEAPSVPGAGLFTPTTNAVLVNEASPHALAMAVGWLHDHTTERAAIVAAARKTVRGSFAMDRQMREYRALYGALRRQHA
jgi:glycosyltransferase involved in cell wall biosynthesis